jgi:hypothetical protein
MLLTGFCRRVVCEIAGHLQPFNHTHQRSQLAGKLASPLSRWIAQNFGFQDFA